MITTCFYHLAGRLACNIEKNGGSSEHTKDPMRVCGPSVANLPKEEILILASEPV